MMFILLTRACTCWLCDCAVPALSGVWWVGGAVLRPICRLCRRCYEGPWEMQSGGAVPSSPSPCLEATVSQHVSVDHRHRGRSRDSAVLFHFSCSTPNSSLPLFHFFGQVFQSCKPEIQNWSYLIVIHYFLKKTVTFEQLSKQISNLYAPQKSRYKPA